MIIAEIGINHGGNMDLARQMLVAIKDRGGEFAKLQLYDADRLARTPEAFKVLKQAELSYDKAWYLFMYGKNIGMEVFFSVFDVERVRWCEEVGVKRYKIAATMRDMATIQSVADTGKPVIMSKSTIVLGGIIENLSATWTWLYCPKGYPQTEFDMPCFQKEAWDGFSDHTIGLDAAKIALARGATIIEKHFSLDHFTGADAAWSMTPTELRELKEWEKTCQTILG